MMAAASQVSPAWLSAPYILCSAVTGGCQVACLGKRLVGLEGVCLPVRLAGAMDVHRYDGDDTPTLCSEGEIKKGKNMFLYSGHIRFRSASHIPVSSLSSSLLLFFSSSSLFLRSDLAQFSLLPITIPIRLFSLSSLFSLSFPHLIFFISPFPHPYAYNIFNSTFYLQHLIRSTR